ncbi:MAG: hypothetical protein AAB914_01255, partial [Patescibacteria group bacterium]
MMEAVDKRWYIGYGWWITLNAIIVIALCLGAMFIPNLNFLAEKWGMDALTLVIAVATLIFRATLYRSLEKTIGLNFAAFIYSLLQLGIIIHLLSVTGWAHSWYFLILLIMYFFTGTIGLFPIIGSGLLTTMYLLVMFPVLTQGGGIDLFIVGVVVLSYVACIMSYFAWRNQYVDQE